MLRRSSAIPSIDLHAMPITVLGVETVSYTPFAQISLASIPPDQQNTHDLETIIAAYHSEAFSHMIDVEGMDVSVSTHEGRANYTIASSSGTSMPPQDY
jgi:hypothetical protein